MFSHETDIEVRPRMGRCCNLHLRARLFPEIPFDLKHAWRSVSLVEEDEEVRSIEVARTRETERDRLELIPDNPVREDLRIEPESKPTFPDVHSL